MERSGSTSPGSSSGSCLSIDPIVKKAAEDLLQLYVGSFMKFTLEMHYNALFPLAGYHIRPTLEILRNSILRDAETGYFPTEKVAAMDTVLSNVLPGHLGSIEAMNNITTDMLQGIFSKQR